MGILKEQHIVPFATVAGVSDVQVILRHTGSGILLGIMREPGTVLHLPRVKQTAQIDLDKHWHVYDTLNKKHLGFYKSFQYGFLPETQALFTLLPYKAGKLLCSVKRTGRKVRMEIVLKADSSKFSDHTFRVDIFDASGKKNDSYSEIIHGSGNRGKHEFVLPLNKNQAVKAVITELLTGIQTQVDI